MDYLIGIFGEDGFVALVVFAFCVVRSGQAERVHMYDGLTNAIKPFMVISALLILLQYAINSAGFVPPTKVIAATGGLLGYIGNSWLIALQKDGAQIEQDGFIKSFRNLIKGIIEELTSYKKP